MTTEDDFQNALDARPDDHNTRLVFADWLDERDDPRAEGVRALGRRRLCPVPSAGNRTMLWVAATVKHKVEYPSAVLPEDWHEATRSVSNEGRSEATRPGDDISPGRVPIPQASNIWHPNRRAAEDAAALAFLKLLPERRAELLTDAA